MTADAAPQRAAGAAAFSRRIPPDTSPNAITAAIAERRRAHLPIIDLTESNPTRVGLPYPATLLASWRDADALVYDPQPLGMGAARHAVAEEASRRGARVEASQVVLCASTSEAYGWLFKLLCDPGDVVIAPQPSYPLFDHLTRLEGVRLAPYALDYHGRWEIDFASVEAAPDRTRAMLMVSPNNPTGSFVTAGEVARASAICRARGWALIVDEVFADYTLDTAAPTTDIATFADVLTFTLGGASKSVGLPQVKLGWIVVGGPAGARDAALAALELIADTYLSVSTPVQVAAADLLRAGAAVRAAIHARVRRNLASLRALTPGFPSIDVLRVEGGWTVPLRVPATRSEESLVLALLGDAGVLVHPGYFFDFPREAFLVLSLLVEESAFDAGVRRVLDAAHS